MDAMTGSKIILPKVREFAVSFREVIVSTTPSDPCWLKPPLFQRPIIFDGSLFVSEALHWFTKYNQIRGAPIVLRQQYGLA
ncbi:hypothetical protein RU07_01735 [Agrobacterium tumefaciens]|uniref:Uncharacterized protein n=1 Tax=Agrobacterium tumefaciens TaxID=358 RepID=A0A0D0L3X8_AGRTU|nr:hypothetical protein RU07_01735 [Agrobacterium tumefaciens]